MVLPPYPTCLQPLVEVRKASLQLRRFYRIYGTGPRPFDLSRSNYKSTCQRFVEKYNELKGEGKIEEEKLFEETGKALLASGIILQRKGTDKVAQQDHQDSMLHLQLQTVLEEMQEKKKDQEEQMPELAETQKENPLPS
ncbi:PREDICTED: 28S ribosomal protein S23, mitochondrial [Eurypyga helias]|uniref:28S ribosomal protein S23, mitochondrial n=1 Tax=Eurypyga helias TaxID=54383 RepID=UPI0005287046|nr:PREDICTED: 28S ribosomal protein S23, mitochondrial [Eurypyga helias]